MNGYKIKMTKEPFRMEQILFAGGDLVEVSRSEGFPKPSVFHGVALSLIAEKPLSTAPSYLFAKKGGFYFFGRSIPLERDAQGRAGSFAVHILVPLPQSSLEKYPPSRWLNYLLENSLFVPSSKDPALEIHSLQGKKLPPVDIERETLSPTIFSVLSVQNLLELSGKLLKDQSLILCGAPLLQTTKAFLEILGQVEKEQASLGVFSPVPLAISLQRPALVDELDLKLIGLPETPHQKARELFPDRRVYNFSKNRFTSSEDFPEEEEHPQTSKAWARPILVAALVLLLVGIFYKEIESPPATDSPPQKKKAPALPKVKKEPAPPKVEKAPVEKKKLPPLTKPSYKAIQKALGELSFFRWPRHFHLSLEEDQMENRTLFFWTGKGEIRKLTLPPETKIISLRQKKLLSWDDLSVPLFQQGPRAEMVDIEKKARELIKEGTRALKDFLENPSPENLLELKKDLSRYDLPLGVRSPAKRDRPLNCLIALLVSLAQISTSEDAKSVFLWTAQELEKKL